MSPRLLGVFFITALGTGCPAPVDPPGDTDATSTGSTGSAGSTSSMDSMDSMTSSPTTTPADGSTTVTSTSTSMGDGSSSSGEPPSFDCPPLPNEPQCDLFDQDCPEGFKCIAWDAEGDLFDPDTTVCAPIDDAPVDLYGTCTNDVATCSDDCPDRAVCAPFFGEEGACLNLCDDQEGTCPADQVCVTCGSCWAAWCMPTCDPLAPDCPPTLGECSLGGWFGQTAFSCTGFAMGPTEPGAPCPAGQCAEGLHCIPGEDFGPDCADFGCCTELCDLEGPPGTCSNPAHTCVPLFIPGQALPSQEHIGICALPEAHPCNTPGLCPPPDIDDTYPWCSTDNENFCPRGIFGFGNLDGCQGCMCIQHCTTDADCPVPPTGNAVPQCILDGGTGENNRCALPCGGGELCPDGMDCRAEWDDVCMWTSPQGC